MIPVVDVIHAELCVAPAVSPFSCSPLDVSGVATQLTQTGCFHVQPGVKDQAPGSPPELYCCETVSLLCCVLET